MTLALFSIGAVGGLVALAALLTVGLGPVIALVVFWLGGLAATLALAGAVTRQTGIVEVPEEASPPKPDRA